jgi:formylglycine-generating enzyme required for sulfatase activity
MKSPPAILPNPFDWVHIPGGQVTLRDTGEPNTIEVKDFYISKYPVTNAQFNAYLQATNRKRFFPRVTDPCADADLHPVCDLWWHEAMQFCEWLSDQEGDLITLPSIAQWQRAAQGDDERRWPWGDVWQPNRCNSEENGVFCTTPVTHYPQGASPYGVMDMAAMSVNGL